MRPPISKITRTGSRVLLWQAQSPEFKSQFHQKLKLKIKKFLELKQGTNPQFQPSALSRVH
jgi:hypothetical protein